MNEEAEKKLKELLLKGVSALNQDEIDFIRARRSYLTASEEEKYASILVEKKAKVEEPAEEGGIDLKELKIRGEAVGVKYKVGTKKEDYLKMVEDAEKANQPE